MTKRDGKAFRDQVVSVFDNFLVTAAADGFVRFYDFKFRLLAWYPLSPLPRPFFHNPAQP